MHLFVSRAIILWMSFSALANSATDQTHHMKPRLSIKYGKEVRPVFLILWTPRKLSRPVRPSATLLSPKLAQSVGHSVPKPRPPVISNPRQNYPIVPTRSGELITTAIPNSLAQQSVINISFPWGPTPWKPRLSIKYGKEVRPVFLILWTLSDNLGPVKPSATLNPFADVHDALAVRIGRTAVEMSAVGLAGPHHHRCAAKRTARR